MTNSSSPKTKKSYTKLWIGLLVASLIAYQFKPNTPSIDSRISDGDRILISAKNGPAKTLAAKAISDKDISAATKQFQAIIDQNRNDPESLIYLNNLKAKQISDSNFAIAVSVPISTNLNVAQEILRGVAQGQIHNQEHDLACFLASRPQSRFLGKSQKILEWSRELANSDGL